MFNTEEIKGKWLEIKGEIAKKWGELSDSDLDKTKGNFAALLGLLEQKLGLKKEEAETHLDDLANRWREKSKSAGSAMADTANDKIDQAKDVVKH